MTVGGKTPASSRVANLTNSHQGLVYTSLLCRTYVASNAIQAIDNEMLYLIISHYLFFELHLTRHKFDIRATYKHMV